MLDAIGIQTELQAIPKAIFFGPRAKLKFSFMLIGWAPATKRRRTT